MIGYSSALLFLCYFGLAITKCHSETVMDLATKPKLSSTHYHYETNCTINSRLKCVVEEICLFNVVSSSYPGKPTDLRIQPFLVVNPTRDPDSYDLRVNLTWRPPFDRTIFLVQGFEVTILNKDNNRHFCFTFNLTGNWLSVDKQQRKFFRFFSENLFQFGQLYHVEIQSLPKPHNKPPTNYDYLEFRMPPHPVIKDLNALEPGTLIPLSFFSSESTMPDGSFNCSLRSNSNAHQWLAGVRNVSLYPYPKQIFIEFVAAPPQFCFEQYEVRLYDKERLLQRHFIGQDQIYYEQHFSERENRTIYTGYGNFTFKDLKDGIYDIGIIPVAHSQAESRCLCPMEEDGHMCSCTMAKWPHIVLQSPPTVPPILLPPNRFPTRNSTSIGDHRVDTNMPTATFIGLMFASFLAILMAILVVVCLYLKYRRNGSFRKYFLPTTASGVPFKTSNDSVSEDFGGMKILHRPVKVVLVYSHDCAEHDAVVSAFAEYLKANCLCEVDADFLSLPQLAENKSDWMYKSLVTADRVVLINSVGSYLRYRGKIAQPACLVRRKVDGGNLRELDDLFLQQLDMLAVKQVLNCSSDMVGKVLSVHFAYTPNSYLLDHLLIGNRYELPRDLEGLVMALHGVPRYTQFGSVCNSIVGTTVNDYWHSCEGEKLRSALDSMAKLQCSEPSWFEALHYRTIKANDYVLRPTVTPCQQPSLMDQTVPVGLNALVPAVPDWPSSDTVETITAVSDKTAVDNLNTTDSGVDVNDMDDSGSLTPLLASKRVKSASLGESSPLLELPAAINPDCLESAKGTNLNSCDSGFGEESGRQT